MFYLLFIGYIIMLISWGWIVVIAFKDSLMCGLLFSFIPFYSVYYIITRWEKSKEPFIIHLVGWFILFLAL